MKIYILEIFRMDLEDPHGAYWEAHKIYPKSYKSLDDAEKVAKTLKKHLGRNVHQKAIVKVLELVE